MLCIMRSFAVAIILIFIFESAKSQTEEGKCELKFCKYVHTYVCFFLRRKKKKVKALYNLHNNFFSGPQIKRNIFILKKNLIFFLIYKLLVEMLTFLIITLSK